MKHLEKILGEFAIIIIISIMLSWPFMFFWNLCMPHIFGLPEIGFWQAFAFKFVCNYIFRTIRIDGLRKNKKENETAD